MTTLTKPSKKKYKYPKQYLLNLSEEEHRLITERAKKQRRSIKGYILNLAYREAENEKV